MSTFAKELLKRLKGDKPDSTPDWADVIVEDYGEPTGCSAWVEIDWEKLEKEIDAFCAEFNAKQP